ncbi:MAG: outer membrane beta-barrel protein [Burkholderiales bacterium]|nr:outer membrane beta-barrel protein [Burkholderiales bacterium]
MPLRRTPTAPPFARFAAALPALAFLWAGATHAAADPTDTLQLNLTVALIKDDNLFRIPDADPRLFGVDPAKKADTIEQLGMRLVLDKTVSRQRFIAEVKLDQNSYRKNDNLDHVAGNAGARWLWQVGNPWDGEVSYERRRYLSGFADLRATIRNLVDVDTFWLTGGYRPHPRWRVWAGVKQLETANSAQSQKVYDTEITTGLLGVEYRTPSENRAGVQLRLADGLYPNRAPVPGGFLNNAYTDTEPSFTWSWNTTGQTRFHGRLGYLVREHEQIPARDFSGPTFRMNFTWIPTGKLELGATAWRELLTYETQTSSYVVSTAVRVVPVWAVTSRFVLRAAATYETRDYKGDPGIVAGLFPARMDDLRTLQLGVVYTPVRNMEISLAVEQSSRDSNLPFNDFDDTTAMLSLKLSF